MPRGCDRRSSLKNHPDMLAVGRGGPLHCRLIWLRAMRMMVVVMMRKMVMLMLGIRSGSIITCRTCHRLRAIASGGLGCRGSIIDTVLPSCRSGPLLLRLQLLPCDVRMIALASVWHFFMAWDVARLQLLRYYVW